MKKVKFIAFLSFLLVSSLSIGQTLFSENFENITCSAAGIGNIPSTWVMYNDINKPDRSLDEYSFNEHAWRVKAENGSKFAASPSFFTPAAKADRWLITPAIDLTKANNPYLDFFAQSGKSALRDGYEVKISTTNTEKASFTNTLYSVKQEKPDRTEHSFSLAAYKGKTIYIAFVQNTQDKYLLYLDEVSVMDIVVDVQAQCDEFPLPNGTLNNSKVNLTAMIRNTGKSNLQSFVANYSVNGKAAIQKKITDLNISTLGKYEVSLDAWDPAPYKGEVSIAVWFSSINGSGKNSDTIKKVIFVTDVQLLPKKNALFEEFSSSMCDPCASANVYLHGVLSSLKANVPESGFVAMKYQLPIPVPGDPAIIEEGKDRQIFYLVQTAPSMLMGGSRLDYNNVTELPNILTNAVAKIRKETAQIDLVSSSRLKNNTFSINVEVTPFAPLTQNYSLFVAFIEDSIYHKPQSNGESSFYYITRKLLPSSKGESLDLSKPGFTIKKSFNYTFDLENPLIFTDVHQMSVVVFVQNMNTKEIMQVISIPTYGLDNESVSKTFNAFTVYPNPVSQGNSSTAVFSLTEPTNITARIYDISGRSLWTKTLNSLSVGTTEITLPVQNLKKGLYLLKLISGNGESVGKKIIVE
ncbi:MAG: choice-of-anchor J domain-containing protein [Bacteroidales bacterium]